MPRSILPALLLAALTMPAALAADLVGFRQLDLTDAGGDRPLHVSLWYPTDDTSPITEIGANPAFVGLPAVRDAAPRREPHPLVLLSHGYGGSWRNLSWLAGELVRQGYAVAAPDHPGTTTFDRSPREAARLWQRPRDLSRVIDALIEDPSSVGTIDPRRIAAIGHSLGGWTAIALGGARFSADRFASDCKQQPNPRTCGLAGELGLDAEHPGSLEADLRDPRVGAIVSLDLGLARGFTPASLAAYPVPALIIGAGVDIGDLPARLESGYLAAHLPKATSSYVEIPDAAHFSFMQTCKPGAVLLIEEETPGDGIVCMDGGKRDRQALHREVAGRIIAFLTKALPPR